MMPLRTQHYSPRAKEARAPPKAKGTPTVTIAGLLLNGKEIGDRNRNGATITKPTATLRRNAEKEMDRRNPNLAKEKEKGDNCGVIYTRPTATQPTGASITLIGQEDRPPQQTGSGARPATDRDTQPLPASQLLSASHLRGKGNPNPRAQGHTVVWEPLAIVIGKARTSLPTTIPIKQPRPCMTNPHLQRRRFGGMIRNWDQH